MSSNSFLAQDIILPQSLWETMLLDVIHKLPEEACGLVTGQGNRASQVIPINNLLHSPVRYRMDPNEQLQAFIHIDETGVELLAIYHSHPSGPNHPSPTDLAEAYYPEAVYLIWFPIRTGWECRGYIIQEGAFHELPVLLVPSE